MIAKASMLFDFRPDHRVFLFDTASARSEDPQGQGKLFVSAVEVTPRHPEGRTGPFLVEPGGFASPLGFLRPLPATFSENGDGTATYECERVQD